jgi:hypothetical protein
VCRASSEATVSHIKRSRTVTDSDPVRTFLTVSRARKRAVPGCQLVLGQRHAKLCGLMRVAVPARHGPRLNPQGNVVRWAPRAALRPFGPRRRRRAPRPSTGRAAGRRSDPSATGPPCKSCHPPGDPVLNRARSPSRARLRRVLRMAQAPLLTLILHSSIGAYREVVPGCDALPHSRSR